MARIYLLLLLAAPFLPGVAGAAAGTRDVRGNLTFDNVPEPAAGSREKLDEYLNARQATPLGFSPKGQLLISTRFGDVDQLHLVERPAGERRQITFLREPITHAVFSPDPLRSAYVYLADEGGNENTQLYYQRLGESAAKCLTAAKSRNGGPVWSNAGREVAFFSTARDGVNTDIDIDEPEAGSLPRLAVSGGGAWVPLDWSPDDRRLLVLQTVSVFEAHLYVVDLSSGQKREVEPAAAKAGTAGKAGAAGKAGTAGKVAIAGAKFSRDGQGVYVISDRDAEFAQLRYVNLYTGEKTVILSHLAWDIRELTISRDGHYLAYVSNEAGIDKLNVLDLKTHQDLIPPRFPVAGLIESLSFDAGGNRLAFGFEAADRPRDAFVLDIATNTLEAWTHSEAGPVDLTKFVVPRLAQFPTFDRVDGRMRQVPAFVYEPPTPGPHPVLIILRGGRESQFRPGFDPWLQYVVNELGFAVVAPNVRGSSGYGKSYLELGLGLLREDAVKDIGALLVWLGSQTAYDAKHVVVSGESYGGYLALAALVNFSDRLVGGVDLAGIADFVSLVTDSAPDRQSQRRADYGDERDADTRAYLKRISPLTNAERISRPLFLAHGKNDPQVRLSDAEQMVYRLRGNGREVWYLQASDEGQSFRKKRNRDAYYQTFAQFLMSMRH
jgi:dipeptidyl aminopeptidase/acylaminoacyl peptidase